MLIFNRFPFSVYLCGPIDRPHLFVNVPQWNVVHNEGVEQSSTAWYSYLGQVCFLLKMPLKARQTKRVWTLLLWIQPEFSCQRSAPSLQANSELRPALRTSITFKPTATNKKWGKMLVFHVLVLMLLDTNDTNCVLFFIDNLLLVFYKSLHLIYPYNSSEVIRHLESNGQRKM